MRRWRPVGVAVALAWCLWMPASASREPVEQATALPGQVAVPPRDQARAAPEPTAVVRGRVVDAATGQPLRRVVITARGAGQRGEPKTAATDDRGRYELRRLPAGDVFLSARKPGYVGQQLGQRRPRDTPRPLTLRDGQVVEQADFALERGGVITGRVVDEAGEPLLNATVYALRQVWRQGKRTLDIERTGTTNDLGVYRVFGLAPGNYFVKGESRLRLNTGDDESREYAPTFYPGVPGAAGAQPVAVSASQESVADFPLGLTRSATVSGVVLGLDGRPLTSGRVQAVEVTAGGQGLAVYSDQASSIAGDGTFTIRGLMPGSWVLTASATRGGDLMLGDIGAGDQAVLPIEITGEDLAVTLTMARGGIVRGHVRFDGEPPREGLGDLQVQLRQVDGSLAFGGRSAKLQNDGTFEAQGVVGRRLVEVTRAPRGWFVREVWHGERDVLDGGIEVLPGRTVAGVEVVLSDRVPSIGGTAVDERGQPASDYTVVAIGEDPAAWFLPGGRHLKKARPNQEGAFLLQNLAPGQYRVLAIADLDPDLVEDPEQLERLRGLGEAVTVTDGETTTVTLRVRGW